MAGFLYVLLAVCWAFLMGMPPSEGIQRGEAAFGPMTRARHRRMTPAQRLAHRAGRSRLLDQLRADVQRGDALLYSLQPEVALVLYSAILAKAGDPVGLDVETVRAYTVPSVARAHAALGDYQQALVWLEVDEQSLDVGHWCGNGAESARKYLHALRTVWRAAILDAVDAEERLRRIAAWDFKPLAGYLNDRDGTTQKADAALEARLTLGELWMRQGRRREAARVLRRVVEDGRRRGTCYAARLAEALLRTLDGGTSSRQPGARR